MSARPLGTMRGSCHCLPVVNTSVDSGMWWIYACDDVPAEEIVRTQADEMIVVGAEYDLPNMRAWVRGRVVIIGDAAHRASTSSGQGASMAR